MSTAPTTHTHNLFLVQLLDSAPLLVRGDQGRHPCWHLRGFTPLPEELFGSSGDGDGDGSHEIGGDDDRVDDLVDDKDAKSRFNECTNCSSLLEHLSVCERR